MNTLYNVGKIMIVSYLLRGLESVLSCVEFLPMALGAFHPVLQSSFYLNILNPDFPVIVRI
jgi:hypothetical protein